MTEYNKRLVEVDEVLKYLSKEDLLKIPEEIRQVIKENKDKEYIWKYDETKPLKDQGLSRDTVAFLSYLNMEYLLNEEQKKLMEQIHDLNERKMEEKKREQYNPDDLFKKATKYENSKTQKEELALVEIKEESFLRKLINKIKKILKK